MTPTIHASALVAGTTGVLVRGASGSGKSLLVRDLLAAARMRGEFAALVSDDRTVLGRSGDHLVARSCGPIAGLIEVRALGLMSEPWLDAAVIRLIVDFVPQADLARMPQSSELSTEIMGLSVACVKLEAGRRVPLDLIYRALGECADPPDRGLRDR